MAIPSRKQEIVRVNWPEMPSVQLTLILSETFVEYCRVKELSTRCELSSCRNAPVPHPSLMRSVCSLSSPQMQAHVHAYAESWFIGTCWHAGVPAAPKTLENFLSDRCFPSPKAISFPFLEPSSVILFSLPFFLPLFPSSLFYCVIIHEKHYSCF